MISPFYGINPAQAENPYFFLYLFQDLNDVIMSYKFRGGHYFGRRRFRSERSQRTEAGGPKEGVPRGPGRVGPLNSALVAPFASILRPEASS